MLRYGPKILRRLTFVRNNFLEILLVPVHAVLALYLRIFRNAKHYHIGQADRIGYYCYFFELYLIRKKLNGIGNEVHIFTHSKPVANKFILSKYAEHLWILPRSAISSRIFDWLLPPVPLFEMIDVEGNIPNSKPVIALTDTEIETAERAARAIDIPTDGTPIVLIFNRDSAYLESVHGKGRFAYHDFRDFPIATMFETAKALVARGYHVVRIGRHFREAANFDLPRFTDYTIQPPDDLLELYLFYACKFIVGTPSGLSVFGTIFRKPMVLTNLTPVRCQVFAKTTHQEMFIPKSYRSAAGVLTVSELARLGALALSKAEHFAALGIEAVHNQANEIAEAAVEMHELLAGESVDFETTKDKEATYFSTIAPDLLAVARGNSPRAQIERHPRVHQALMSNLTYDKAFARLAPSYLKKHSWISS